MRTESGWLLKVASITVGQPVFFFLLFFFFIPAVLECSCEKMNAKPLSLLAAAAAAILILVIFVDSGDAQLVK